MAEISVRIDFSEMKKALERVRNRGEVSAPSQLEQDIFDAEMCDGELINLDRRVVDGKAVLVAIPGPALDRLEAMLDIWSGV